MLCAGLLITPVRGAGLWLYETATPDMGTASAGRGATAMDASVAGSNPAAMTKLDRSQLLAGAMGIIVNVEFDVDEATFGGGDGGNAGDFVPAGSFHYVHSVSPDLKLGVSAGSYFGLGLDYDDDWAGRYYVTEGEFLTFGINPGVGYRINSWLSLGAGFSILYAKLEQKAAINNQLTDGAGFPDGEIKIEDDDVGYGFNLGTLIELSEATRLSITYRSKVEVEFEDVADLKGVGPNLQAALDLLGIAAERVDLEMQLPQAITLSGYHDLSDRLALVASVGWQDWSEFGETTVNVKSTTSTSFEADRNFKDTWHAALGARYRFAKPWLWSVGVAYDSSPVDDDDRTPDLPLDRQIRLGTGLQYDWNEDITLGAAYTFIDAGDAEIEQEGSPLRGDLKGDYETNHIHAIAVNLIWKF
jgi:long-chain fatty acid transport protein